MWSALHKSTRLLLASMAFTMAFLLTPRVWVSDARAPSHSEVPVNSLDQSQEKCLWCDAPASTPEPCEERDWFDRDDEDRASESANCNEERSAGAGPNA